MEEKKEFRVTAGDGKVLLQVYDGVSLPPCARLEEICAGAVRCFGETLLKDYGERLRREYEENPDRRKRIHVKPLTAKCESACTKTGEQNLVVLRFSLCMGRKELLGFEEKMCFDGVSGRVVKI